MNCPDQYGMAKQISLTLIVGFLLSVCAGCGAAGAPIAPEDVGLEAKIREQQKPSRVQLENGEELVPLEEEAVQLPNLHSVGTR